jgi:tetratricopeptide (TPR) repeat protein
MYLFLGYVLFMLPCNAQEKRYANTYAFPPVYNTLSTDTARMRFLIKAILDSLDEGQVNPVLGWSKAGLAMAQKSNTDTMKGLFYFGIGKAFTYAYSKYDSAIYYYKKVLPYFPDKLNKYYLFSVREIMDRYSDLGNKDSSFVYMDKLKAVIDTMPDNAPKKISLSQNIAVVFQSFGMYRTAIQYFQTAIKGNKLNKNNRGLGLAMANLAELYNQMEEYEKAVAVSKEALVYLADVVMPYMQTAANIADFSITLKQYDTAKRYLQLSDSVVEKIDDSETRMSNKTIQAKLFMAEGKFEAAQQLLDTVVHNLTGTDNSWTLCQALVAYADLDTVTKQMNQAKIHLGRLLGLAKKNDFRPFEVLALQRLAAVYATAGDYEPAFQYQQQYIRLQDSLSTSKSKSDLNDLEISYQTVQKEQEIQLLKSENDIKTLQLQKNRQSTLTYIIILLALLSILGIIFYQRSRRHKIETRRIKAELQTQILRSQMNPHFIFNCLNSIENFILQNDKRQASDYLNKFSQLIRSILDSSRNEVVPIAKDMEALKLYVELEQLRFNNKFTFRVNIDPALAGGDYLVPSLLVQPFVENAIVHGMAHSEEKDLSLIVTASLQGDTIKYTIQDNGIGREKAKVYNMHNKPYHKSVGLKITEERINIYNDAPEKKDAINIIDLYDANKKPDGTKVEIVLKAM